MSRLDRLWNEAAEWCGGGPSSFRDPSIAPSEAVRDDPLGFLSMNGDGAFADEVVRVVERRRLQLPSLVQSIEGSRILLSSVAHSVTDGASHHESKGWFDEDDFPPWGAWMAYAHRGDEWLLVSYAPSDWLERIDRGVWVNPVDLMRWATLDDLRAIEPRRTTT